jgi:hypothetical protein
MPAKPNLTLLVMRGIHTPFVQTSPCAGEGAGVVGEYRPHSLTTARAGHTMRRTRPRAEERRFRSHPKRRNIRTRQGIKKKKATKTGEHPEAVIAVKPRIVAMPMLLVMRDISHSRSSRYRPAQMNRGGASGGTKRDRSRLRTTNSWHEGAHHRIQTRFGRCRY